ncbi:MAG: CoA-binding protein [bacterium]|jgi:predicted CoA-binding protein|nr:CoA-binding protein [bacterium]
MSNKTIAVVGASNHRKKYGNIAVRAWRDRGFTVYPVNPNEEEIEGIPCFKDIRDVPAALDAISVYLPPRRTLAVLDAIAEKGAETIFLNPGTEDEAVLRKADELNLNVVQACSIIAAGSSPTQYETE